MRCREAMLAAVVTGAAGCSGGVASLADGVRSFDSLPTLAHLPDALTALCARAAEDLCPDGQDCACEARTLGGGAGRIRDAALLTIVRRDRADQDVVLAVQGPDGWVPAPLVASTRADDGTTREVGIVREASIASTGAVGWLVVAATNLRRRSDRSMNANVAVSADVLTVCGEIDDHLGCIQLPVAASTLTTTIDLRREVPPPSLFDGGAGTDWALTVDTRTVGRLVGTQARGPVPPDCVKLLGSHSLAELAAIAPAGERVIWPVPR